MPLGYLDWNIRETNGELSKDKGWTLVMLYSRSDALGRCYPSQSTIMKEVGCASEKLNKILDWLVERGAIIKVDVEHRINHEQKLNPRQTVYQLTGILRLEDGTWKNYLYLQNKETIKQVAHLIQILRKSNDTPDIASVFEEIHTSIIEQRPVKGTSKIEHEGNTSKEKVIHSEDNLSASIRKLIEAWLKASEVIDKKAYGKKGFRDTALALHEAGITPEDVTAFIMNRRKDKFWCDKGIKFGTVANDILPWKAAHRPPMSEQSDTDDWQPPAPEEAIDDEKRQQMQAMFEDLARQKMGGV